MKLCYCLIVLLALLAHGCLGQSAPKVWQLDVCNKHKGISQDGAPGMSLSVTTVGVYPIAMAARALSPWLVSCQPPKQSASLLP